MSVAIGRALTVFVRQSLLRSKPVQRLMQGRAVKSCFGPTSRMRTASPPSLAMCVHSAATLKLLVIFSNFQVSFKQVQVVRG